MILFPKNPKFYFSFLTKVHLKQHAELKKLCFLMLSICKMITDFIIQQDGKRVVQSYPIQYNSGNKKEFYKIKQPTIYKKLTKQKSQNSLINQTLTKISPWSKPFQRFSKQEMRKWTFMWLLKTLEAYWKELAIHFYELIMLLRKEPKRFKILLQEVKNEHQGR